jgi:hypothetical protein
MIFSILSFSEPGIFVEKNFAYLAIIPMPRQVVKGKVT